MSGEGQFFIQPSSFQSPDAVTQEAKWYRAIPAPGAGTQVPAVGGVATCANLAASSPPTVLEKFEVKSYSVTWALLIPYVAALATPPNATMELALLVNDRIAYVDEAQPQAMVKAPTQYVASGAWRSDLVNAISLGARERLGLRLGFKIDQTGGSNPALAVVGLAVDQNGNPLGGGESTISYNVIDLPASRRL
jgi:hypothetical protein